MTTFYHLSHAFVMICTFQRYEDVLLIIIIINWKIQNTQQLRHKIYYGLKFILLVPLNFVLTNGEFFCLKYNYSKLS